MKKKPQEKQISLIILGVLVVVLIIVVIFSIQPKDSAVEPSDDTGGEVAVGVEDEYEKAPPANSKANIQVNIVE